LNPWLTIKTPKQAVWNGSSTDVGSLGPLFDQFLQGMNEVAQDTQNPWGSDNRNWEETTGNEWKQTVARP